MLSKTSNEGRFVCRLAKGEGGRVSEVPKPPPCILRTSCCIFMGSFLSLWGRAGVIAAKVNFRSGCGWAQGNCSLDALSNLCRQDCWLGTAAPAVDRFHDEVSDAKGDQTKNGESCADDNRSCTGLAVGIASHPCGRSVPLDCDCRRLPLRQLRHTA